MSGDADRSFPEPAEGHERTAFDPSTSSGLEGPENEDPLPAVIRLTGITKRFRSPGGADGAAHDAVPEVIANDGIDLELRRGRVHCLLGENGSGKSTLIGMLAGLQQPDAGSIEIDGVPTVLGSPAVSIAQGIGVVHQHSTLIPTMSVLENLMLGTATSGASASGASTSGARGGAPRMRLDRAGARARLAKLSDTVGTLIDPDTPVSALGLGQRQQLEIAAALNGGGGGTRCLVLDEPTSMLTPQGVESLLARVRGLVAEGVAVLFVTHKLHEAYLLGDEVTVLRRGRVVDRIGQHELSELDEARASARLLAAMFGTIAGGDGRQADPVAAVPSLGAEPVAIAEDAPVVLRMERVSTGKAGGEEAGADGTPIADVSLEIRAGEMLGIAGIDGHGQRQLAEAIAGQRACTEGRILLSERPLERLDVRGRRRLGLRYVTDDRLDEGIVRGLSVALNLVLKQIGERPFWRRGRMDRAAVRRHAEQGIAAYDIRPPQPEARAGSLSGGNIQKLLLARELADDEAGAPRLVVVSKPSYGLDLKTVARVHGILREFVRGGGAVLLISSDLDELVALCGRIAVMSGGRLVGEVRNDGDRVDERVGELMAGTRHAEAAG